MMATSNFLVPNGTFIVELIGFLIVLGVVARYLLPPINRALHERQARIQAELDAADKARTEAAAADDERRRELEDARRRGREILEAAERAAERARADGAASAQEEHDRIVASATQEVNLAKQRALDEATTQVGQLVMEVVERVIGREVDERAHRDLVEEAISALHTENRQNTGNTENTGSTENGGATG
jgi:F-type H+-transporting ATPase subunit b